MYFHSDHTYQIILQSDRFTFIYSIFNVHLFMLTKILIFHFFHRTYNSRILSFLAFFFILNIFCYSDIHFLFFSLYMVGFTYDSELTMYFKFSLNINFCFIFKRTYNSNFTFNFLFVLVSLQSFIKPTIIFLDFIVFNDLFVFPWVIL